MDKIAESKKRRFPLWLTSLILAIGVLPGLGITFYRNSVDAPVMSAYKEPARAQGSWKVKAICNDGWLSQSQGSGTCSGHGGIDRVVDTTVYGESLDACRKASMQNYRTKKRQ